MCTVVDPESVAVIVSLVGPEIRLKNQDTKGFENIGIDIFQKQIFFLS